MSSSTISHVHPIVFRQDRLDPRRRILRDYVLRPIGFGLLVKVQASGVENVPASGPTLLVMNHIAAIDPFIVAGTVRPRLIVPMSKIENYRNPIVGLMAHGWGAYPVRRGEPDRQALDSTIALLEQGRPVLIAPEGTRRPVLSEAKHGMTYVAIRANAVVVPIGLDGTDQFPKSLLRLRRARVSITFGRPFRFRVDGRGRVPRDQMHQMTREAMWQLAALLPEHRRGAYRDVDRMTTDCLEFLD